MSTHRFSSPSSFLCLVCLALVNQQPAFPWIKPAGPFLLPGYSIGSAVPVPLVSTDYHLLWLVLRNRFSTWTLPPPPIWDTYNTTSTHHPCPSVASSCQVCLLLNVFPGWICRYARSVLVVAMSDPSSILKLSRILTSILYPFAAHFCSHRYQMLSPTLCFYHSSNLHCPSIDSDFNSSTYLPYSRNREQHFIINPLNDCDTVYGSRGMSFRYWHPPSTSSVQILKLILSNLSYVPSDTCIPLSLCFFSQTLTQFVLPEHLSICGSWHTCHGTLLWYWHNLSSGHLFPWVILTHNRIDPTYIWILTHLFYLKSTLLSDTHTLDVSDIYLRVLTPSLLRTFSQPITILLTFRCWHP